MSKNQFSKEYGVWVEAGVGKHRKQRKQEVYRSWAGRESGCFREQAYLAGTKSEGKEGLSRTRNNIGQSTQNFLAFTLR